VLLSPTVSLTNIANVHEPWGYLLWRRDAAKTLGTITEAQNRLETGCTCLCSFGGGTKAETFLFDVALPKELRQA